MLSKACAKIIQQRLTKEKYDLIIAPTGNALIAHLNTNIPIVYIGDRTVAGAFNYHEQFRNLFAFSEKQSRETDKLAMEKASLISFPSYWAGDSAIKDYGVAPEKVAVIPFGANLDEQPEFNPGIQKKGVVKLLFAGTNWKDKGGDIVLEAHAELKRRGIASTLIICGSKPPMEINDADVIVEGFLNKDNPSQYNRLMDHFRTSDFFILPTRYEAYGLVFCESAAYSLPVIATNTGGIPTIVKEGETGFLLPPEAGGKAYAEKIILAMEQPGLLEKMRKNSYERYKEILNWDHWIGEFKIRLERSGLLK
jgi:glycosyltransferase involved in cell wall biosynthesis